MSFENSTIVRLYRFRVYVIAVAFFVVLIGLPLASFLMGRNLRSELREAVGSLLPRTFDTSRILALVDRVLDDADALGIEKARMEELADGFLAEIEEGFDADLAVGLLHRINTEIYGNAFLREDMEDFEKIVYKIGQAGSVRSYEINHAVERAHRILDTVKTGPPGKEGG